jgi:type IV pilus assembly protein PilP
MKHLTWLILVLIMSPPLVSAAPEPDSGETAAPDAMKHLVKAPEIDFVNLRDPFESYLTIVAARNKAALVKQAIRKNNRELEFLESFDLSSLKLVATFSMSGELVAMVENALGKGYIVRRGNYMGKNFGRIEKMTDDTIFLVEQVMNPAGEVIDRQVSLTMKEVNE